MPLQRVVRLKQTPQGNARRGAPRSRALEKSSATTKKVVSSCKIVSLSLGLALAGSMALTKQKGHFCRLRGGDSKPGRASPCPPGDSRG